MAVCTAAESSRERQTVKYFSLSRVWQNNKFSSEGGKGAEGNEDRPGGRSLRRDTMVQK